MNLALIIGFFVLFSPQSLWAVPVLDKTDSSVTSNISSEELQNLPLNQRNYQSLIKLLPTADNNNFTQNDISGAQVKLRDDLKFITDANRQPANLDNSLKEYLSHLPQDTQQIIDKIGSFKSNPGNFYGGYDFAKFNNPRVWNIYPQEMPKISAFTPQEQIWQKNNISFGRLGISEMNHQWNFGLATYNKNNWEWRPSYKLGESYGINGPIIAYTKTPKGPDLSIYSADGYFVGDVTRAKLKADPYVTVKYIIKARYYGSFGRPHPYDRFIPISGYVPYNVMVLPYGRSLGDDFQVAKFIDNRFAYSDSFYDEDDDCDDEDYYYYHEDECDVFYHYCIAPFLVERIRTRTILANVKDPNDAFFPSLKPKKKSGGSFFSGLISVITPVGVILPSDTSNGGEVNIIDQYSLPQIGFTDKSNPDSAWNVVDTKGPNVVVAVIDSGVDLSHPDGPEFIWQNPEDGTHGWNFLDENSDITDQRGHGTMIAGIIAAKTNNGMGIAGINPGAVIMPLKVADKKGYANSLNIYRAIHFAVDHGARVINIS